MKTSRIAIINLIFISAIWGATFPIIKNAISAIDPFTFVFARFLLAALLLLPLIAKQLKFTNRTLLTAAVVLGLFNAGAFILQTIGLQTINSSRAAFITGMNVIMVPFIMPFFKLGHPKHIDLVSALFCGFGLYILTGANFRHISLGDLWVLIAAFCSALAIAYIQWSATKIKHHSLLAFYQIFFTWPFAFAFAFPIHTQAFANAHVMLAFLFCAIFATSLALYLQMKYQKHTTASKAALIYMLEPVFASFFGWVINDEPITKHIIIGGAIIFASIMLQDFFRLFKLSR